MSSSKIVTRFAPSPTGALHIGGARTALFNWLFARANGGTFLLRIEDTDKARSTDENRAAILDGLGWLGLDWDGEPISQAARADRHAEVALGLLESGAAYKCYASQDEIQAFRDEARAAGKSTLYRSPWRDADPSTHPDAPYVIRLRAPQDGETTISDAVLGDVTWKNDQLDDLILLRSDGSPVYMLAVVVDDHDMGVTHVIRGDDHLANAFRQKLIYEALGWDVPVMAHIPLIYGPDGKKLSKRHGATGAAEYRALGYPAAAMRNYLTRLGWSHGDDEFFTDAQAREWFSLDGIGKAPARFDFKKLENLSGQHMAAMEDDALLRELDDYLAATGALPLTERQKVAMRAAIPFLKKSAKTFPQLLDKAHFLIAEGPIQADEKAAKSLDTVSRGMLSELTPQLHNASWDRDTLEDAVNRVAAEHEIKMGKLAAPLRAALAGKTATPSVFDMMLVLGREESLRRIEDAALGKTAPSHD